MRRHTGLSPNIANLGGDVEEVNLVYVAGLMQCHGAEGVLDDTTDEDRVQRLIAAPHEYKNR